MWVNLTRNEIRGKITKYFFSKLCLYILFQFNYLFSNSMELTLELSCCKFAKRERLLVEWDNNFKSLLAYVEQAQRGIKGIITDTNNNGIR